MRQVILTLFVIFVGTLARPFDAGHDLSAQTIGPHVTPLLNTGVSGVTGKEWDVITVELAPGALDARHSYPGVELVYVLEGAGFLEVDGKPPVALNPGVVAALNPKQIHVLKNTSQTQTLKVVVVLLLEKGHQRPMLANQRAPRHQGPGDPISNGNLRQQKTNEQNNSTNAGLVF
ncbi:MAG: cupin domain-containing protein [Nitrospirae bacterium]|nr:MAG: cupin domain-containing protein [Nitrospirota bacterium]